MEIPEMADYWIKLYHEIIDDPKMATLPDRLWRRAIELFLLAGRLSTDKSGQLPGTDQLAWLLRMQESELQSDLLQLKNVGVITESLDGWFVINFSKRQAAVTDSERKRKEREKRHADQYANVTNQSRNVTQSTESETESESEAESEHNDSASSLSPLSIAFVNSAKIPELSGGAPRWLQALSELEKAGVEPQDIEAAVNQLREKGYTISSLRSIVNPAITAMAQRKSSRGNLRKQADNRSRALGI